MAYINTPTARLTLWLSPAVILFLSSNFVNAGNLVFNMLFSRWMGPELFGDLAFVLTVKLGLLGVLGALQMAVTQKTASDTDASGENLGHLARVCFLVMWFVAPLASVFILSGPKVGLSDPSLLAILILSTPFMAPLSILRGVVQGRMDVPRIVLTANVEMAVRLGGGIVAWHMGWGIHGVVVAMALSIVAAWAVVAGALPRSPQMPLRSVLKDLSFAALPFAILQGAQVILLDGDIFLAKFFFSATDAGLIAALGLFQRVEFFACFALSAALLPMVTKAVAQGQTGLRESRPVVMLFVLSSLPFVLATFWFAAPLIQLLVGERFLNAAPALPAAGVGAVAFTFSYLLATFLIALKDQRVIWIIALFVPIQMGILGGAAYIGGMNIAEFATLKAGGLITLALILLIYSLWKIIPLQNRAHALY